MVTSQQAHVETMSYQPSVPCQNVAAHIDVDTTLSKGCVPGMPAGLILLQMLHLFSGRSRISGKGLKCRKVLGCSLCLFI